MAWTGRDPGLDWTVQIARFEPAVARMLHKDTPANSECPVKPAADFKPMRFSTQSLDERERIAHWRELCGRTMMKVDMEPLHGGPFHCTATLRALPGLALAAIESSPNRLTRTRQLVADGNDDLLFVIATEGIADITAHGRETTLRAGQARLLSSADPSTTVVHTTSRFLSFAIPLAILSPLIPNLDQMLDSIIPGVEAVRLLTGYAQLLTDDAALPTSDLRRLAGSHMCDLVALALGATRDAAEVARLGGLRAARLQAIKSDIADRANQPAFSIDEVAARHGLSPRYIRKLFETTDATFTGFVLEQRLKLAYRILSDPRRTGQTISTIAFEVGFSDLSYFNRTFRRRYGIKPSDVRDALPPDPA